MTLQHIIVFAVLSLPFMWLVPQQRRPWGLFGLTILAVIWLMTDGVLNRLDVLLFSTTVLLVVALWWLQSTVVHPGDYAALGLLGLAFVSISLLVPQYQMSLLFSGMIASLSVITVSRIEQDRKAIVPLFVLLIVLVLIALKYPPLAELLGASLTISSTSPLAWLGFSYVSFRLIAVLLDYRAGRVSGYSLRDLCVYVLFFPSFTAGPIDRSKRFITELNDARPLDAPLLVEGLGRIAVGIFKKFVVADSLALLSMSPSLIERTDTILGLWLLVYVYAFQIFFDFSGYSDVAIGIGRLYGLTLPENFNRPYLQANIQQFWQRWHITLSTWFRVYYFTPFTRMLIKSQAKPPQWTIVLSAQLTTMILIGLWHGITLNFLLWGIWHGSGLFLHKLLADNTKGWYRWTQQRLWSRRLMYSISTLATFHFVALSWVLFALPTVSDSVIMYRGLFGLCGTGC